MSLTGLPPPDVEAPRALAGEHEAPSKSTSDTVNDSTAAVEAKGSVSAPAALRELTAWLIWRLEHVDGEDKPRKVPYYANGGRRYGVQGAPHDRAALVTFDQAVAACERRGFSGVGIAMLPEWGFVGLDFDDCVDVNGNVEPWVDALCADTYCELSPSGEGVHAFMRGALPNKKAKADDAFSFGFETFHSAGFLTFTGRALPLCEIFGNSDCIAPLTQAVNDHYAMRFGAVRTPPAGEMDEDDPFASCDRVGLSLEEAESYLPADNETYSVWLNAGMALHHEFESSEDALDLWDKWSESADSYSGRDDLESRWAGFGRNNARPVTMRSLIKLKRATARPADAPFESVHATTDAANAVRLANAYGGEMAYTPQGWAIFNGRHWEHDEAAAVRRGMNLSRIIAQELGQLSERIKLEESDEARARQLKSFEALAKFGVRSEDTGKIMAALSQARNLLMRKAAEFDADPWLLNCQNGTVDLRTGDLRAHAREDYITRITKVPFDPAASREHWIRFLTDIIPAPEVIAFIKRVLGYCLTGLTIEQVMIILWGFGANGKSTLLDIIQSTLGDYVRAAPPRLLEDSRAERHPTS